MQKRSAWFILIVLMLTHIFGLSACDGSEENQPGLSTENMIAVTILPQATFVKAVCGDLADVVTMVPPGYSPENYEPDPAQIQKLEQAVVYFSIGVPTEEANILPRIQAIPQVDLAAEAAAVYPDRHFDSGARDPHTWLSVRRVIVMVQVIADTLSDLDPGNETVYRANADAYIDELKTLDQTLSDLFSGVKSKTFIAYHPSFGYLADDYGLNMVALEHDGKEATPRHLQSLIDLANQEKIHSIFTQAEIDSRQSLAFAESIDGQVIILDPLSEDYINNMLDMAQKIVGALS